ncbi:MAG: type II secretion system F family protein [Planctomycetes bacterium]|nr:type II secretion system F family protein [Planctomycetota bacterium]
MPIHLILIATFVGVAALVAGAFLLFSREPRDRVEDRLDLLTNHATARRGAAAAVSVLVQPLDERAGAAEVFVSRFFNIRRLIDQSGLSMSVPQLLLFMAIAAGAAGAITALCHRWVFAPPAAAVAGLLPIGFVLFKRKRRLAKFARQLPEALELISRALRAGHSLAAGISLVADEMPAPIATEFGRCYEEQNLGIPLDRALDQMTDRVPNLDLRFLATAIILQRQTGGDLAEILDKIGYLVRERFKIWGAIQALTGEGRLSGIVLLALPPVLFAVMYRLNPDYCKVLFNDPLGQRMLLGAIAMQLMGAYVIRKIIRIKV